MMLQKPRTYKLSCLSLTDIPIEYLDINGLDRFAATNPNLTLKATLLILPTQSSLL